MGRTELNQCYTDVEKRFFFNMLMCMCAHICLYLKAPAVYVYHRHIISQGTTR